MNSQIESTEILIVGGGVGGGSLAIHLIQAGISVTVIDQGQNKSSVVAAGLINPLVFRRMTKSWRVDEILPYAVQFYQQLETYSSLSFYHPITIRRFFSSVQEREFWTQKQELPEFESYMTKLADEDDNYTSFGTKNDFGSGRVKSAAWVNTPIFLEAAKGYITERATYLKEAFIYADLNPEEGTYREKRYDKIVFAEGYQSRENPWFMEFPVQSTKGEVLTVLSETLPPEESINRKCFVLPTGNRHFRIGATYSWNADEANITLEGKQEILENLSYLTDEEPTIIDHLAGIRPTSPDRRPIMGQHLDFKRLYIFNGLGTKGYMIAPLLAAEFTTHLLQETELDPEVNLKRFKK
jgi:glycine oxidase